MRFTRVLLALSLGLSALGVSGALTPASAATAPLKIMPLGASMTYGYNSTDGNGYREELRNLLVGAGVSLDYVGSQKSGNAVDNDNEGHSGYRIDQVAAGTDAWLAAAHPDLVLLNVGTNDTIQNFQLATAPDRLSALIDQILKDDPTATVMMSTLMPNKNVTTNSYVDAFNAKLPAIAQAKAAAGKKVHLVDIHAALTLADIGSDGIHPTDGGYVKIADAWYNALQPVLGAGQTWPAIPTASTLKGTQSGRCLDVTGANQADGTAVALWDCNGGTNQRWTPTATKRLMVYGTKCLDANGNGTANGTAVQIWDCNGGTNQQWSVNADGSIVGAGSGKCLDAYAQGTGNGTKLELWDCNGGANQKWARA